MSDRESSCQLIDCGSRAGIGSVALATVLLATALGFTTVSRLEAQEVDVEIWNEARTRSFLVRSNAEEERVAEIARTLEVFRAAFAGLAPELELKSPVPTRFLAFRDERSFSRFRSGGEVGGGRILGQFLTHPDGNFLTLNADPRFLGGVGVVLHEYVHYLVTYNFPGVPRWFNEGLAEYYSTFAIEGESAVIGRPVERHLAWLQRYGRLDLREVLDAGGSNRHFETEAGHFYAVSWGLVHFLLSSVDEATGAQLATFLADSSSRFPSARFEEIFEIRLEDLEEKLRRYLLPEGPPAGSIPLRGLNGDFGVSVEAADPAEVLNDLGALLARLGDDITAGSFFNLALEYDSENGDAYAELGYVRHLGQRFEEAAVLFSEAIRLGPRQARSYLLYGRHLLARLEEARLEGEAEAVIALAQRAVEALRVATDLMPDFAEAWALLGATHLVGGLEPEKGIGNLERAIELLPGRVDLHFQLLQLELRAGDSARARQLAEGSIRQLGGEEWGLRADEEIERMLLLQSAEEALGAGRLEEGRSLLEEAIRVTTDPDLRYRLESNLERLNEQSDRQSDRR